MKNALNQRCRIERINSETARDLITPIIGKQVKLLNL